MGFGSTFLDILKQIIGGWRPSQPQPPRPQGQRVCWNTLLSVGAKDATITLESDAVPGHPKVTSTHKVLDPNHLSRIGVIAPPDMPPGIGADVTVTHEGFIAQTKRTVTAAGDWEGPGFDLQPVTPPVTSRRGVVTIPNRAFHDDDGSFLGVGASLFWGVWGATNDPDRLQRNLEFAKETGIDYVRTILALGPTGGWEDRAVNPTAPDWPNQVDAYMRMVKAQGLRVEPTIFGGIDFTDTKGARADVVRKAADVLKNYRETIQFCEIANEGFQNGFPDVDGVKELNELSRIVRERANILVAATAFRDQNLREMTIAEPWTLASEHLDRSQNGTGGLWRPCRQPWEVQFLGDPKRWTSNEPIGPQSSVAEDDDPERLVVAAVTTWMTNGAGWVYHTGAGIRGGGQADINRGRVANFWEVKNWMATTAGLKAAKTIVPATIPNWMPLNGNNNYKGRYPFDTDTIAKASEQGDLLRAYLSTNGVRFLMCPMKVERDVTFKAERRMSFTVHHTLSAQKIDDVILNQGQSWTCRPSVHGRSCIVTGLFI